MSENKSFFDLLKETENDPYLKLRTFNKQLMLRAMQKRKPMAAMIELLPVCNLSCKVCYIKMTLDEIKAIGKHILTFDEWKYYIDGIVAMGVVKVTFTGGECTIHPDFVQIYIYAYKKGLEISIISNGSNITDNIIELFKNYPPFCVNVTIYGSSEDTYEEFCGNRDAYRRVYEGVNKLVEAKIRVRLQFTAGKENIDDLLEVCEFAKKMDLSFSVENKLVNYNKCNVENLDYSRFTKQKIRMLTDVVSANILGLLPEEYYEKNSTKIVGFDEEASFKTKGLICNAARGSFVISWDGCMRPCIAFDVFSEDPHDVGGLEVCWKHLVEWADNVPLLVECQRCIFRLNCARCIAMHYNDTHEFG